MPLLPFFSSSYSASSREPLPWQLQCRFVAPRSDVTSRVCQWSSYDTISTLILATETNVPRTVIQPVQTTSSVSESERAQNIWCPKRLRLSSHHVPQLGPVLTIRWTVAVRLPSSHSVVQFPKHSSLRDADRIQELNQCAWNRINKKLVVALFERFWNHSAGQSSPTLPSQPFQGTPWNNRKLFSIVL